MLVNEDTSRWSFLEHFDEDACLIEKKSDLILFCADLETPENFIAKSIKESRLFFCQRRYEDFVETKHTEGGLYKISERAGEEQP